MQQQLGVKGVFDIRTMMQQQLRVKGVFDIRDNDAATAKSKGSI